MNVRVREDSLFFFVVVIIFIVISLLMLIASPADAQNARLSQISNAPSFLNPGLSGRNDGGIECALLSSWQKSKFSETTHQYFHIQGKSDFRKVINNTNKLIETDSISLTKPGRKKTISYWGWNINYYQYGKDLTGSVENKTPLTAQFFSAAVAKHFYFPGNDKHYLGIGLSFAYASGKVTESKQLYYDKEITGGGFRYRPTRDRNKSSSRNYTDWNFGGYYGYKTSNFYYEVGAALSHLFYPRNDIFDDAETKLRHRASIYSVFGIDVSKKYSIIQKNIYWTEGLYYKSNVVDTTNLTALWSGVELRRKVIGDSVRFFVEAGLYTRSFKTIMPMITVYAGKGFKLCFSKEWPINSPKYKAYSAERTELSLFYVVGKQAMQKNIIRNRYLRW